MTLLPVNTPDALFQRRQCGKAQTARGRTDGRHIQRARGFALDRDA